MPTVPANVLYATTSSGEGVAVRSMGAGQPLVVMPTGPWDTLEAAWSVPAWRAWYEALAARRRLVLYDLRGTGLSLAPASGALFGLEAQVEDLAAVIERLQLQRVALLAAQHAGPAAIAYCARNPDRVAHLMLWCTYARAREYFASTHSRAVHGVLDHDWRLFTETVTHAHFGWTESETAGQVAATLRAGLSPELIAAFDNATASVDVTALLPELRVRTTVLHPRDVSHPDLALARQLAAAIPGAELVIVEGSSIAPFVGNTRELVSLVDRLLGTRSAVDQGAVVLEPLSPREMDVLRLLAAGHSNSEIAVELVISQGTAKSHTASILRKLDVSNRTRAVARGRELCLMD
jgi:ATP/maltotriose-dependent transcriptional regulator MalT